jgi:hypothetical protein
MTISTRTQKLLIALIGVLAVVLSYFLVFAPTSEKNETLTNENAQLNARISELKGMQEKEEEYISETERLNQEVSVFLMEYPSYLMYENGIMDVVDLEKATGAFVSTMTLSDPVVVSVGSSAQSDAEDGTADQSAASSAASRYSLYDANTALIYSGDYSAMKNMLTRIVSVQDKRSISTFSATFDNSTGEITGAINFESYFIYGQEKDYEPADIPGVKHGTDNIFGSVDYETETEEETAEDAQGEK